MIRMYLPTRITSDYDRDRGGLCLSARLKTVGVGFETHQRHFVVSLCHLYTLLHNKPCRMLFTAMF